MGWTLLMPQSVRGTRCLGGRQGYGEVRIITAGYLRGRFVVMVWTERGEKRHIISTRHGHEREEKVWADQIGRSR
jgi:uncharacterized DUF497 family protein